MGFLDVVVLSLASVAALGGAAFVGFRELARMPGRRRVGRARDTIEVLLPIAGVMALVALAWAVAVS